MTFLWHFLSNFHLIGFSLLRKFLEERDCLVIVGKIQRSWYELAENISFYGNVSKSRENRAFLIGALSEQMLLALLRSAVLDCNLPGRGSWYSVTVKLKYTMYTLHGRCEFSICLVYMESVSLKENVSCETERRNIEYDEHVPLNLIMITQSHETG